jgi:hypothetical protein
MTDRQNGFLDLYSRYRVGYALRKDDQRARQARIRRGWLLAAPVLFGLATLAEILAATKVAVVICAVVAAICAVAGLALAAGIVASESASSEVARINAETRHALALARDAQPDSDATDREIAAWVGQVEGVLRQADPEPDPPVVI